MKFRDTDVEGAAGFLASNMAHIEADVYRQQFPEYKYAKFVPLDQSAPEMAAQIGVRVLAYRGGLQRYSALGTDQPTADVAQNIQFVEVHTFATGYRFSVLELNQAKAFGSPLDTERVMAVRATAEADTNRIMLAGGLEKDGQFDATGEGLFTSPNVPTTTSTATIEAIIKAGGDGMAQTVLNAFNAAYSAIYTGQTNTLHKPNMFVMPPSLMRLLGSTLLGPNNGSNFTLLQFLRVNYPECDFDDDITLENAGVGGTRRLVAYKKDIRVVKGHMVQPLRFHQMEGPTGMTFYVPATMRTAGVEWRVPKAAHYVDGI